MSTLMYVFVARRSDDENEVVTVYADDTVECSCGNKEGCDHTHHTKRLLKKIKTRQAAPAARGKAKK